MLFAVIQGPDGLCPDATMYLYILYTLIYGECSSLLFLALNIP